MNAHVAAELQVSRVKMSINNGIVEIANIDDDQSVVFQLDGGRAQTRRYAAGAAVDASERGMRLLARQGPTRHNHDIIIMESSGYFRLAAAQRCVGNWG